MDSVRPQHRPGPKPTKVACLRLKFSGDVVPPFSSLRLFVFVNNLKPVCFHDMPFLLALNDTL